MSTKGKRYSTEEKQKVIDFVTQYNLEHNGRGGVANASKEFGITQMTINGWLKKEGMSAAGILKASKNGNIYQQLGYVHEQIALKEAELEILKKEFEVLKGKVNL